VYRCVGSVAHSSRFDFDKDSRFDRCSTPMSEMGGMGVGRPISAATCSIPFMNSVIFSGYHSVT